MLGKTCNGTLIIIIIIKKQSSIFYNVYGGCCFFTVRLFRFWWEEIILYVWTAQHSVTHVVGWGWSRRSASCFNFISVIVRSSICKCCGLTFLLALIEALQRFLVVCFESRVGVVVVVEEKRRGEERVLFKNRSHLVNLASQLSKLRLSMLLTTISTSAHDTLL